jgi:F-type H+-transporting ATPase subunit epsilon
MTKLNVKVLSPEAQLASAEAIEVSIPAVRGYMGLRPAHTPIIGQIGLGSLEIIKDSENRQRFFVSGGYFELIDDELTVLVDMIEKSEEIDVKRIESSMERALQRLNDKTDLNTDIPRALASLERAKARKKLVDLSKA